MKFQVEQALLLAAVLNQALYSCHLTDEEVNAAKTAKERLLETAEIAKAREVVRKSFS